MSHQEHAPEREQARWSPFVRHTLEAVLIVAVALFLWQVRSLLLLAFLGLLLAVLLRGLATRLSARTPLSVGWSLVVVGLGILALLVGLGFLLGPRLVSEFNALVRTIPDTWAAAHQQIQQTPLGQVLPTDSSSAMQMLGGSGGSIFTQITGIASTLLNGLTHAILVIVLAVFFASDPDLYRRGLLSLVPPARRARVGKALDAAGHALWLWLIGKLVAMVAVGVITGLGLSLLGVPLPLVLGVIAGVFDFVTFLGPLAAAVPGVLLGLTQGVQTALLAALLYLVVQQLEGNVVTPLIQRRAVSLPPVLTVISAIGFGVVFGLIGIVVGVPLMVVLMVLIKVLYIEGALHDEVSVPGQEP